MTLPAKVDYTMLSTFLTCRKKYWWRMVRNLVPLGVPTAADFGKAIHLALDEWWTSRDAAKAKEIFRANFTPNPEDDKRTYAVGEKLLELYDKQYRDQSHKLLATETFFDLPFNADTSLVGRIDKIVEWDGVVWVMDHKTTSRLGESFFYKLSPNLQFDAYVWACRKMGYEKCSGVILDALLVAKGLVVPAQLQRLTPVLRDVGYRSPEQLERFEKIVLCILEDMELCYDRDEWYENYESCTDFNECPYRKLCKEDVGVRERLVGAYFREEKWEPSKGAKEGVGS